MKRAYELMVLLKSDFDGENSKKREEIVKKLLGDSATLKEVTSLGKKQLAYPIIKETEAIYLLANVSSDGLKLEEINKHAKLDEQILRFLLLGREEHGKQKSK
ncbi:30S ribosomal protein S6 [Candidatus Gottesmanbacteria bacterium RIFCSPLOWO2_01_FULL_43_11b]|uniref:Small ribosomal subunit protein bS6 n=1 Tax=Candidatus Gottesmanbacteria bacterium RIFCSPLOWO2_01_FULL_43_11b TaxID=1798392 RepID=A0A1F6AG44_9BACT|nr:MAG: 30S ribosomal protein S6 [Candidatus Gottesmanbacteria bacterium RIFCSPLOWO2_01_FULL_43_11b]